MRPQILPLMAAVLVILFLGGCGGSTPTPVSEAPAVTSAPEQTVATSTPEPPAATSTPEPPTATPTPEIVKPQPGVTLMGEIKESKTADSVTINLKVSGDGTSISQVDVAMVNLSVECSSDSASGSIQSGGSEMSFMGPFPITDGVIDAALSNDGKLQGKFTSPTEANGTINVIRKEPNGVGGSMLCDFGTWEWSAKVK